MTSLLGPIGVPFASAHRELPSPGPEISIEPLKETRRLIGAVYAFDLGGVSVGVGAAQVVRLNAGTTLDSEGRRQEVRIEYESSLSPVGQLRFVLAEGPGPFADAVVNVTSLGVSGTVQAGWQTAYGIKLALGYHYLPEHSGPVVAVGATF